MSIAIASQTSDAQGLHFGVCPNWRAGACACQKDQAGNPVPAHPSYTFPAEPPRVTQHRVEDYLAANPQAQAPAPPVNPGWDHRADMAASSAWTLDAWAKNCAQEALLLVKEALTPPAAPAQAPASQVGTTL